MFIVRLTYFSPLRGHTLPGRAAIPGQRMERMEQAPIPSPTSKIHLLYCPWIENILDIKLLKTDTILDLRQMAEK